MSANNAATPAPTLETVRMRRAFDAGGRAFDAGAHHTRRPVGDALSPDAAAPVSRPRRIETLEGRSSGWVRAPQSGILRTLTPLGARVEAHQCLGRGAHTGRGLFHIARLEPGAEPGAETLTTLIPDLEEARATETPVEPPG